MYLLIPVPMCQWALTNKFVRPFQVYVQLKFMCDGMIKIGDRELQYIAESLGYKSIKPVKSNIKLLQDENWIGYDKVSGYYFIRGFEKVRSFYGLKHRTCAEFSELEIKKFKGFIAGAVIGKLVNVQKRRKWERERKKGRSIHLSHQSFQYFPVANIALAKILKIAPSTAFLWKKEASRCGYILIKKTYKQTGLSLGLLKPYQKEFPETAGKFRKVDDKLVLQYIDLILPTIRFKSRKKIKS